MTTIEETDPCTLCVPADHTVEDHPECNECGGTWMPLTDDICGNCREENEITRKEHTSMSETFQTTFSAIFNEAFQLLVERQRKYGPKNIEQLGLFGVFGRLADDKIERIRRGMNGVIEHGIVTMSTTDFDDESFEDALMDIANYALIMIALKRGVWGHPLA